MVDDQYLVESSLRQQQKSDAVLIPKTKVEMTIHAVHETLHEVDEDEAIFHQPPSRSSSIPSDPSQMKTNKKRSAGNVVLRRKRSVPNMGTHPGPLFAEETNNRGRRSNSFKYYSTGYFFNDIKLPTFGTSPVDTEPQNDVMANSMGKSNKEEKKLKKKSRGLRRTLSMPIFQKHIKGNFVRSLVQYSNSFCKIRET